MKNFYRILLILALALVLTVGAVSLVSWKQTEGVSEKTVEPPQFSLKALFDGTFIPQFEEYYTATFPARQTLMGWNQKLNRFYYYSGASEEDNMLVLDGSTGAEQGGESLGDVEAALNGKTEPDTTPAPDTSADITSDPSTQSPTTGETTSPETGTPPEQPAEPDPALDNPDESEASYAGSVVVVGTRAMEIPTADEGIITSYAKAVDDLAGAMGENTRTISLITPNGGEFYSPESLHTGLHSQKDMIDLCPDLPFQPLWRLDQIQSRHPAQPLAPFLRRGGHLLLELQRLGLRLKARLRRVYPLYLQFHPSLRSGAPPLSRRGPIFYLPSNNLACACVKPIAASCSLFGITPAESSALPLSASRLSLYFFAVSVVWP